MDLFTQFDAVLKEKETDASAAIGYIVGKSYPAYQDNVGWDLFIKKMQTEYPQAYTDFKNGDGGELEEKDGKPPKMASYASSSRMIYLAAQDAIQNGFRFEWQLPTTVGGTANLDGFMKKQEQYIFVEAKCREPYTHSGTVVVGKKYETLYNAINERFGDSLLIKMEKASKESDMKASFFVDGQKIERFDLKQMISHLLGIATAYITKKWKNSDEEVDRSCTVRFLYYLFDPAALAVGENVLAIYKQTCEEIALVENVVSFGELFRFLVRYLADLDKMNVYDSIDETAVSFSFTLCDTDAFRTELSL